MLKDFKTATRRGFWYISREVLGLPTVTATGGPISQETDDTDQKKLRKYLLWLDTSTEEKSNQKIRWEEWQRRGEKTSFQGIVGQDWQPDMGNWIPKKVRYNLREKIVSQEFCMWQESPQVIKLQWKPLQVKEKAERIPHGKFTDKCLRLRHLRAAEHLVNRCYCTNHLLFNSINK